MTDAPGPEDDWTARAAQVLPTEHFTLQGARSATIADSSSRATIFLGSVSASLVALGLIAGGVGISLPFKVVALVLLPTLLFLGVATFYRVVQSSVEDMLYARGINRIRHFYLEFVPEAAPYFIMAANDDSTGVMRNMGITPSRWQLFLTTAGTVGVIDGVIAGVVAGLVADLFGAALGIAVAAGAVAFAVVVVALYRVERAIYAGSGGHMEVRFPSGPSDRVGDGYDGRTPRDAATKARR